MGLGVAQVRDMNRPCAPVAAARLDRAILRVPREHHLRGRASSEELHAQPVRRHEAPNDQERPHAHLHAVSLHDVGDACQIRLAGRIKPAHLTRARLRSGGTLDFAPNLLVDAFEVLAESPQVSCASSIETFQQIVEAGNPDTAGVHSTLDDECCLEATG